MKHIVSTLAIALALLAGGCGSGRSNSTNNVNGNWTATLLGTKGSPSFAFTMTLNQSSGIAVSVTNLDFTTASPCFTQGSTTASGGFTLSGNFNGMTSGTLTFLVKSMSATNNVLNLNGTVNNNTVTGTWTLSGTTSGCTGSGSFTLQR